MKIILEIRDDARGVINVLRPVEDSELAMRWIWYVLSSLESADASGRTSATVTIYPLG